MSKITLQEHLMLCAQLSKTFTNENLLVLNEAVVATFEEIVEELGKKANSSEVNTELSKKADSANVNQALALKANSNDVKNALDFFNSAGLYVDADGDIAQKD